ncbi:hypothetical protein NQ314_010552 [Rhamnusium bicolor]|uniref:60S ribosomal protein L28 n=1 Tax=Rhamnusium bicolor TaxID=1586634 RepID=A0AAV8XQL8_9CUCU|nr:hypothetical protein NQ314_010552 [Rhamnusium bicolor]
MSLQVKMSSHLVWGIIRNNNAFLMKKRNISKPFSTNKPRQGTVKRTMKSGPRRSLYKLKRLLNANKYRTDLTKAALRRASAVLRSQKPLPPKKQKAKKTE